MSFHKRIYLGIKGFIPKTGRGDMRGLNTLEYQPAKVTEIEGNWETDPNIPLLLLAIPNQETRSNNFEIAIPNGAPLILKHKANGLVPGHNDFVLEDSTIMHPRVSAVFFSFRIIIGTGVAMLLLSWGACVAAQVWRGRHAETAIDRLRRNEF